MAVLGLRRLLVKNMTVQIAAQGLFLALGLVTSLVLSRYLGVEGFGQFNYVFAFYYFFQTINDFGVNTIIVREVSQQRDQAAEIIGAMLLFKCGLATASLLGAWVLVWMMELPAELRNALWLFGLVLPILALQVPVVIFQVNLQAEFPALVGAVNRSLGFILIMVAVVLGRGLPWMFAALVLSEMVSLSLLMYLSGRWLRPVWRFAPDIWLRVLRSSIPLGLAGLCNALINRIDFIMLERMTDLHQLGLYSAAYKVTNLLESLPLMLMVTVYPLMAQWAKQDIERLKRLYWQATWFLALVAIPMGAIVTLGAPWIVQLLFGEDYLGTVPALRVLVWSTVSLYLAITSGNLLISLGREQTNLGLNIFGAVLNVALNFWLIPTMGFVGAALATTITFVFTLLGMSVASFMALNAISVRSMAAR